jgi:16S rRNA (cytosine967-C5)-methyltransferase
MTELVLGCLRRRPQLRSLLEFFSGRKIPAHDCKLLILLEMGVYQLRFLDRVPPHAVVNETVELAKKAGKSHAAGFVNAVLRKFRREAVTWEDPPTAYCLPAWIWNRWVERFGEQTARRIGEALLQPPEHFVRVPPGQENVALALGMEPVHEVPGCWIAGPQGPGPFRQQDISSQMIVPLLDLQPGLRLLDLCAAPGNKTLQAMERQVWVLACERSDRRLASLRGLGCPLVRLDATQPLPFGPVFDRVLVDAPCSGTGTLGRNPEIRWRVQPEDLARLAGRQKAILRNALAALKPGGRLVYATCSLEKEENEEVVVAVLRESAARLRLRSELRRLPGLDRGDGFYAAVLTS